MFELSYDSILYLVEMSTNISNLRFYHIIKKKYNNNKAKIKQLDKYFKEKYLYNN